MISAFKAMDTECLLSLHNSQKNPHTVPHISHIILFIRDAKTES